MIRTLIVDDQKIVRQGIKILLEQATEIEIVGTANDGSSALEEIEHLQPDIVLLDISMPDIDGLTVAAQIRDKFPQIKVIMLSAHEDEQYVQKITKVGAKGYLLKSSVSSQQLEWSIKLVNQGYSAIKSELLEKQLSKDITNHETNRQLNLDVKVDELDRGSDENLDQPKLASPKVRKLNLDLKVDELDRGFDENLDQPKLASPKGKQEIFQHLELLLARNQVKLTPSSPPPQQRPKNSLFRGVMFDKVKLSQAKKTMNSFEFKLLVFIILFSLGFLVFIALS